jgi:ketosteroid isomerase-like protein
VVSGLEDTDDVWTAQGQDFHAAGRFSYTAPTPDGDVPVTGRYEATWTRDTDGQWRVSSMRSNNDPMTTTTQ